MMPIESVEDYLALRAQGFSRHEAAKRLPIGSNRLFYEHLKAWGIHDANYEEELLRRYLRSEMIKNAPQHHACDIGGH